MKARLWFTLTLVLVLVVLIATACRGKATLAPAEKAFAPAATPALYYRPG